MKKHFTTLRYTTHPDEPLVSWSSGKMVQDGARLYSTVTRTDGWDTCEMFLGPPGVHMALISRAELVLLRDVLDEALQEWPE